jgi:nucleoside-diphosphate-sugar epimerase
MRVLVLGGNGFLGKALLFHLRSYDDMQLVCGDLTDPAIAGVEFNHIDILDSKSSPLIRNGFDVVINCTGQVTTPINKCYALNSAGIDNLINSVKETDTKVVHISSVSVYGSCQQADEDTAFNPETPYSTCKAYAEYLLSSKLQPEQLAIVRLSNLYGPGQTKGVAEYMLRSYFSDRQLQFNNDGSLVRYFLNVEDCVVNLTKFFAKRGSFVSGVYNLLGNDRFSVTELIALVERMTKTQFATRFDSIKPYDNTMVVRDERIRGKIDVEFRHSVESYFISRMGA